MAFEYTENEDGTLDVYTEQGDLYMEGMPADQIGAFETYESKGGSPLSETGLKRGVQERNAANLKKIRHDMELSEKMENPKYAKQYEEYKTGVSSDPDDPNPLGPIPSWTKTGLHMMDEFSDLGDGIEDAIGTMEHVFASPERKETLGYEKLYRDREREAHKAGVEYDVLQETTGGLSKLIGGGLPYLLAAQAEVPLGAAIGAAARGTATQGAKQLSKLEGPPGSAFNSLSDIAEGRMNRYVPDKPYNVNRGEQVLGTGVLGVTEGAVNPESTAIAGLTQNLGGTLAGRALSGPLRRTENLRSPEETVIMNDAKTLGKVYMPGVKYGDIEKQITESTMRGNPKMVNSIKAFDDANAKVDNRVVAEMLGMHNPDGKSLLSNIEGRRTTIKQSFDALSKQTKGKFSKTGLKRLQARKAEFLQNPSVHGDEALRYLEPYLETFNRWTKKVNPRSKRNVDFDGTTYQRERAKLDQAIKSKAAIDNPAVGDTLRLVRDELDAAVRNGTESSRIGKGGIVDRSRSESLLSRWEKAREDYALVDMVYDKGLKADGSLDMQEFHTHFMGSDKKRYLGGDKQNRMHDVYTLSKSEHMKREMKGAGLGGKSIEGFEGGRSVNLGERAKSRQPTFIQEMILDSYRAGASDIGFGPEFSGIMGRQGSAGAQSLGIHDSVYDTVVPPVREGITKLSKMSATLWEDIFNMGKEEEDTTQAPNGAMQ